MSSVNRITRLPESMRREAYTHRENITNASGNLGTRTGPFPGVVGDYSRANWPGLVLITQALTDGESGCSRPIARVGFIEDGCQVVRDGFLAQEEEIGDLTIALSVRNMPQDTHFTLTQSSGRRTTIPCRSLFGKRIDPISHPHCLGRHAEVLQEGGSLREQITGAIDVCGTRIGYL